MDSYNIDQLDEITPSSKKVKMNMDSSNKRKKDEISSSSKKAKMSIESSNKRKKVEKLSDSKKDIFSKPQNNDIHAKICKHGNSKNTCKQNGHKKAKIIRHWLFHRRQEDKNNGIFDTYFFIDTDYLKGLLEDNKYCFYNDCNAKLQYKHYGPDYVAIDRLDKNVGHIKSNCVLCCVKCHYSKQRNEVSINLV